MPSPPCWPSAATDRCTSARLPARRLPAVAALTRPLPPAVAERAPRRAVEPPGGGHRPRATGPVGRRRDRHGVGQVAAASSCRSPRRLPRRGAAPGTALLVFPTKALAHDQLRAITALGLPGVVAGAYDGDASAEERAWVRRNANVVLTNPEMLHCGILPHHARWSTFLVAAALRRRRRAARRSAASSAPHVAHVLRRLRRLRHASRRGADVSSRARRRSAIRRGSRPRCAGDAVEAGHRRRLAAGRADRRALEPASARRGVGTARVRRTSRRPGCSRRSSTPARGRSRSAAAVACTEVVADRRAPPAVARPWRACPRRTAAAISPRSGARSRTLLSAGELDGVVTTTALELGIDVGGLDAVVLDGFPGTIASFWQQAGRAGRNGDAVLAVLVAGQRPARPVARAPTRPSCSPGRPSPPSSTRRTRSCSIPTCACAALRAAAAPQRRALVAAACSTTACGVSRSADELAVRRRAARRRVEEPIAVWDGAGWPAHGVGLRAGAAARSASSTSTASLVGTVDVSRAPEQVHDGAVVPPPGPGMARRRARPRRPRRARRARRRLDLHRMPAPTSRSGSSVPTTSASIGGARAVLGEVEVTTRVVGYQRKDALTGEVLGTSRSTCPPAMLADAGVLVRDRPGGARRRRASTAPQLPGALARRRARRRSACCRCSRSATGGTSAASRPRCHADTGAPTIVIYDGYPGGAGIAELGYEAGRSPPRGDARGRRGVPVPRRLPVVRAVTQVRQRQRAPRQGTAPSRSSERSLAALSPTGSAATLKRALVAASSSRLPVVRRCAWRCG